MAKELTKLFDKPVQLKALCQYYLRVEPDRTYRQEFGIANIHQDHASEMVKMGIVISVLEKYIEGYNHIITNGDDNQKILAKESQQETVKLMAKLIGLLAPRYEAFVAHFYKEENVKRKSPTAPKIRDAKGMVIDMSKDKK